jgi:hypothetical protein
MSHSTIVHLIWPLEGKDEWILSNDFVSIENVMERTKSAILMSHLLTPTQICSLNPKSDVKQLGGWIRLVTFSPEAMVH